MAVAEMGRRTDPSKWSTSDLDDYVGGLSRPSKMPGWAFSLPAAECRTGSRLRTVKDSVCQGCYAMKGRYPFPGVQRAMYRRLRRLSRKYWIPAMAELIRRRSRETPYFRWHDSGDLQGVAHLAAIVEVARATPTVAHWIPTREYRTVTEYVEGGGEIPPNLNIRMSAHLIGGHCPTFPRLRGLVTVSTVTRGEGGEGFDCPSRLQGNKCGDCRACWDRDVPSVNYRYH